MSTDDPPFFHANMTREYEGLEKAFGWGEEDFAEITETALAAAFCDDTTKTKLRERLNHE